MLFNVIEHSGFMILKLELKPIKERRRDELFKNNKTCDYDLYSILATFRLLLLLLIIKCFNRLIFSLHYSRFKHIT